VSKAGFLMFHGRVMFLMWARRGGACGIGIAVSPFFLHLLSCFFCVCGGRGRSGGA